MRLIILCEGATEEAVLRDFLSPYCPKFSRIEIRSSDGRNKLKQKYKSIAERELRSDLNVVVFCLLDLHETPFPIPKEINESADPLPAAYKHIQKQMKDIIDPSVRNRFHAFPVVMEIETWLLADGEALRYFHPSDKLQLSHPENELHPAQILNEYMKRYKKREYQKVKDGIILFKRASAARVLADNCPHFDDVIHTLSRIQGLPYQKPRLK